MTARKNSSGKIILSNEYIHYKKSSNQGASCCPEDVMSYLVSRFSPNIAEELALVAKLNNISSVNKARTLVS